MENEVLPVQKYTKQILSAIEKNKITIIKGPTGCGKSTYLPYILSNHYKRIAIIQPRRIAVTSLYNRLKESINVGYKIRFSRKFNKDCKVMIYTDGMFLNEKKNFDLIIVDEVHERTIRIDTILSIIKQREKDSKTGELMKNSSLFKLNSNTRVVLMSATVDIISLQKFFNAEVVEIEGDKYPLEIFHEEYPVIDYLESAYYKVKEILNLNKEKKGDILVFLTGEDDINELYKMLTPIITIKVYKIFSAMDDCDQNLIFEQCKLRKVILSTNICETSVTIPNIRFVIDSGVQKIKIYNQINFMGVIPICKQSADQRAGRANRTAAGVCYRLYTETTYKKLGNFVPEILRVDIRSLMLQIIRYKINISNFIDIPSSTSVRNSLNFLLEMGFIEFNIAGMDSVRSSMLSKCNLENDFGFKIDKEGVKYLLEVTIKNEKTIKELSIECSEVGNKLLEYPLDVNLTHFLNLCIKCEIAEIGAALTAMFSLDNYNFIKRNEKNELKAMVDLFRNFLATDNKYEYCRSTRASIKGLEKSVLIYKQLLDISNVDFKSRFQVSGDDLDVLYRVFSQAFRYNISEKQSDGSFIHKSTSTKFFIPNNEKSIVFVDMIYIEKMQPRFVGKYFFN